MVGTNTFAPIGVALIPVFPSSSLLDTNVGSFLPYRKNLYILNRVLLHGLSFLHNVWKFLFFLLFFFSSFFFFSLSEGERGCVFG